MLKKVIKTHLCRSLPHSLRLIGALCVLGVTLQSCENLGEDSLGTEEALGPVAFSAAKGVPVVLNFTDDVSSPGTLLLRVGAEPTEGSLEMPGNSLGVYEASEDVLANQDQFTMLLQIDGREVVREYTANIVDRPTYPLSEGIAVYDRGGIIDADSFAIADVLANDRFEQDGSAEIQSFKIEVGPSSGEAIITEDNQIQYTPDPDTNGLIDVIYSIELTNGDKGYALVRFLVGEIERPDPGEGEQDDEGGEEPPKRD